MTIIIHRHKTLTINHLRRVNFLLQGPARMENSFELKRKK